MGSEAALKDGALTVGALHRVHHTLRYLQGYVLCTVPPHPQAYTSAHRGDALKKTYR